MLSILSFIKTLTLGTQRGIHEQHQHVKDQPLGGKDTTTHGRTTFWWILIACQVDYTKPAPNESTQEVTAPGPDLAQQGYAGEWKVDYYETEMPAFIPWRRL